jgi:D-lactate dehydrogenase (cytochrome)
VPDRIGLATTELMMATQQEYLNEELGSGTVELMETVKRTLDPYGIMNPGKLYPNRVAKLH